MSQLPTALHFSTTKHWLDQCPADDHRRHCVEPRMSAQTMLNMVNLKNSILGIKRSLYEENIIAEEQKEGEL